MFGAWTEQWEKTVKTRFFIEILYKNGVSTKFILLKYIYFFYLDFPSVFDLFSRSGTHVLYGLSENMFFILHTMAFTERMIIDVSDSF